MTAEHGQDGTPGDLRSRHLTAQSALNYAWGWWLTLLLLPAFLFLFVLWNLMWGSAAGKNATLGARWFIAMMAYLLVATPLAAAIRSRLFRRYWEGRSVSPASYLAGHLVLWITLEIGGLASLIGCLLSHSLLPNLVPAMVAFVLFMPLWPGGWAMTRPVGNLDDTDTYREPR